MTPEAIGTMVGAGLAVAASAYAALGHRATAQKARAQVSPVEHAELKGLVAGLQTRVAELGDQLEGIRVATARHVTDDTFATFSAAVTGNVQRITREIGEITGEMRAWRERNK